MSETWWWLPLGISVATTVRWFLAWRSTHRELMRVEDERDALWDELYGVKGEK